VHRAIGGFLLVTLGFRGWQGWHKQVG